MGTEIPEDYQPASRPPPQPREAFRRGGRYIATRARSELQSLQDEEQLARALGWFSIALGLAEIVAPRGLARLIGVTPHPLLLRTLGVREIAAGIGILAQRRPAGWMQARVAGDAMDLSLLGLALSSSGTRQPRAIAAITAVAGVTALDVVCSRELNRDRAPVPARARGMWTARPIPLEKTLLINRSPQECYALWRDLTSLPRFMKNIESVQPLDDLRSHWKARLPGGAKVEWESQITEDKPNESITWRSQPDAQVTHSGSIRFELAPGGRGTLVRLAMQYHPPGGRVAVLTAKLIGQDPERQVQENLRRFKQLMEAGELATTHGQPAGHRSRLARTLHLGE